MVTSMPFGDVIRERYGRPANLACQFEFIETRKASRDRVHLLPELARNLIDIQVLKRPKLITRVRFRSALFNVVTHLTFLTPLANSCNLFNPAFRSPAA